MNNLPYRPNVCLFIYNLDKKFFLGKRLNKNENYANEIWQLPQGGTEAGETLEENALREAYEEMGLENTEHLKFIKTLNATNKYKFDVPPKYAKDKWCGQSQNFCLIEYTGKDSDIKLDLYHAEFSDFTWVNLADISKRAEPIRAKGYTKAILEIEKDF